MLFLVTMVIGISDEDDHVKRLSAKEEENHVKMCEASMNYWREKVEYSLATDEITLMVISILIMKSTESS